VAEASTSLSLPEWEWVPDGFAVRDPRIQGWNVESILQTQNAKWPRFVELIRGTGPLGVAHEAPSLDNQDFGAHNTLMSYAYVLSLAARHRDDLTVLDWGSGVGHYYHISRALLPEVRLDYHCKDVPMLCQGGRELSPGATFHDRDDCLRRAYDLVLVSGSLQYSEDWKGIVARLATAARSYLYVTRLPVVRKAASFAVVQRPSPYGYRTEYLGWFLNREEFLGHLTELGMELRREFLIYERPHVSGAPEQCEYRGFLFLPRKDKRREEGYSGPGASAAGLSGTAAPCRPSGAERASGAGGPQPADVPRTAGRSRRGGGSLHPGV
jgi:putative methyltransferase (TIGR04325 family)